MARLRAGAAAVKKDEDELPDLATLLFKGTSAAPTTTTFEPRIQASSTAIALPAPSVRRSDRKRAESPKKNHPRQTAVEKEAKSLRGSPRKRKPRHDDDEGEERRRSAQQQWQQPLKLAHVNSLLLPLSQVVLNDDSEGEKGVSQAGKARPGLGRIEEGGSEQENDGPRIRKHGARAWASKKLEASRFVLEEARCDEVDDEEGEGDEDAGTDLSGFIVDDDADLSIHISSDESEVETTIRRRRVASGKKKKLQRGRKALESEDEPDRNAEDAVDVGSLAKNLFGLKLEPSRREPPIPRKREIEVVDLTGSPEKASPAKRSPIKRSSSSTDPDNDAMLKFSPPRTYSPIKLTPKAIPFPTARSTTPAPRTDPASRPTTPTRTTTPPRPVSPTKLKSPSKAHLLSPSKRGHAAPRSPYRPSIDAFWSSDVINTWHDQFSPKKAPLASPRKNRLAQFSLWADEESEEDSQATRDGSDPPTPCTSPHKATKMMQSPEKKRIAEQKKARKEFAVCREDAARELLAELDSRITEGKLASMSGSTGGVKIVWSKTLRSTAGRANWRRTVTKSGSSGSPIKGSPMKSSGDVLVQHYASIELAEKVIDSNEKLANTLAHEFCHMANFMVSNVRDQPHGVSFRAWAERVTSAFRGSENEAWRQIEVTTKHSYAINHKYLWVCAGREMTDAARWLRMEEGEDGCGAEYGRHSKSIDTEKHRCGKCKGMLVQVRPVPRRADPRRQSPRKNLFQKKERSGAGGDAVAELGKALEVVELSD